MNEIAIYINNLHKKYDQTVYAVQGIDLSIRKGEFYGLLGPNGAGKSTTINAITSLVRPTEGNIKVFDRDIVSDFRYARSKIGISPQEISNDWFFPVEQLLYFQAGFYGITKKDAKERIDFILHKVGLYNHKDKKMRQLSGGMKRRLQIARALAHNPEILILDIDEAELLCERVGIINNGKLVAEDTVSNLKASTNKSKLEDVFLELTGRKLDD